MPNAQTIAFTNAEVTFIVDNLCRRNVLISQSKLEKIDNYTGCGVRYKMNPYAARKLTQKRVSIHFKN